jgi:hypothetical protein
LPLLWIATVPACRQAGLKCSLADEGFLSPGFNWFQLSVQTLSFLKTSPTKITLIT